MKIKLELPGQLIHSVEYSAHIGFTLDKLQQFEDSICTEMHVGHLLDYHQNRDEILTMLVKKIRYGGNIIIYGTDLQTIATDFVNGDINEQQAMTALYNKKQSCSTLEYMKDMLTGMNMKIVNHNIIGNIYTITAQRPNYVINK